MSITKQARGWGSFLRLFRQATKTPDTPAKMVLGTTKVPAPVKPGKTWFGDRPSKPQDALLVSSSAPAKKSLTHKSPETQGQLFHTENVPTPKKPGFISRHPIASAAAAAGTIGITPYAYEHASPYVQEAMQPYVDQYYFKVKPGMQGALGMEQDAVGKYSDPRNARLMQVESKVQALAGLVAHNPKLDMGYRPEDAWDASARDLAYKDHRNVRTVRAEAEGEYAQKLRQLYQDNDRRLQELGGNYPRAGSAVIGALGGAGIGALIQYLRGQDAMGGALAGAGIGGLGGAFTPELSNILGMGNQNEDQ